MNISLEYIKIDIFFCHVCENDGKSMRVHKEEAAVEQRRDKRIDVDIKILMEPIGGEVDGRKAFYADVVNVSKSGVGFTTPFQLEDNSFYKARLVFQTKESVDTIIETVRHEDMNQPMIRYGGKFIGISEKDQFKIEVFRMFAENEEKQEEN